MLTGTAGNARDAADKEFLDVDPDTGRVIMSWSNFTATSVLPGGVQISTTFSDDIMTGNPPTWSAQVVLNPGSATFDTGSVPRRVRRYPPTRRRPSIVLCRDSITSFTGS